MVHVQAQGWATWTKNHNSVFSGWMDVQDVFYSLAMKAASAVWSGWRVTFLWSCVVWDPHPQSVCGATVTLWRTVLDTVAQPKWIVVAFKWLLWIRGAINWGQLIRSKQHWCTKMAINSFSYQLMCEWVTCQLHYPVQPEAHYITQVH